MVNQVKGKTFMFTGTLSVTRDEAQRIVEELGGIAGSSITRETDYLVCGEDQVGKSNKWMKAGLLGITRVDEDHFWNLVREAKNESELDVGVCKDEVIAHLEGDDFTDEQWEAIKKNCPNLKVMTSEQLERLLGAYLPSYQNPDKLAKLRTEYHLELLPPSICKFCKEVIPYSIHKNVDWPNIEGEYYCFACKNRSTNEEHRCIWFDPGVKAGVYMCSYCGNFIEGNKIWFEEFLNHLESDDYYNSAEYLIEKVKRRRRKAEVEERVETLLEGVHVCTEFEIEGRVEGKGSWLKCKVCGNSKFIAFDKFEARKLK